MADDGFCEPTTDDLLQEEQIPAKMQSIPVVVEGPVRTHPLAARTVSMRQVFLGDTPTVIAGEDMRRSSVKLYATSGTAAFFVSQDRGAVTSGHAARYNSGVAVEFNTTSALYAKSATASTQCDLSVVLEQWAD